MTQGQDEGGEEGKVEDDKDIEASMQEQGEGRDKDRQDDDKATRSDTGTVEARSNMKKAQERLDDHTIQKFLKETKDNPHLNESPYVKLAMQEIKSRNQKAIKAIRHTFLREQKFDSKFFEEQLVEALGVALTVDQTVYYVQSQAPTGHHPGGDHGLACTIIAQALLILRAAASRITSDHDDERIMVSLAICKEGADRI